jgi:hypothetical protein
MRRAPVAVLFLVLFMQPAFEAGGLTLYVRRAVVMDRGPLTVGRLIQTLGDVPTEIAEALERDIGEVTDTVQLVPSSSYKMFFDKVSENGIIMVGKRTVVVPKGTVEDAAVGLLDKLVDYMESQGLIADGRVVFESLHISGLPAAGAVENPLFKTVKAEKTAALVSGAAEFSFSPGSGGSGGRITLRVRQDAVAPAATAGVKANDAVSVFFRKGSIVIEMSGKALASAREGERVGIYVPESRLNFTGIVEGNKAVSVEIDGK